VLDKEKRRRRRDKKTKRPVFREKKEVAERKVGVKYRYE